MKNECMGTETLVLVEDETMLNEMLAQALKRRGYTVLQAFNGADALRLINSHTGDPIRMVISDIVMPEMGGRELIHRLREDLPGLAVLMISGYTGDYAETDKDVLAEVGFLRKPFTTSVFIKRVRQILDGESVVE